MANERFAGFGGLGGHVPPPPAADGVPAVGVRGRRPLPDLAHPEPVRAERGHGGLPFHLRGEALARPARVRLRHGERDEHARVVVGRRARGREVRRAGRARREEVPLDLGPRDGPGVDEQRLGGAKHGPAVLAGVHGGGVGRRIVRGGLGILRRRRWQRDGVIADPRERPQARGVRGDGLGIDGGVRRDELPDVRADFGRAGGREERLDGGVGARELVPGGEARRRSAGEAAVDERGQGRVQAGASSAERGRLALGHLRHEVEGPRVRALEGVGAGDHPVEEQAEDVHGAPRVGRRAGDALGVGVGEEGREGEERRAHLRARALLRVRRDRAHGAVSARRRSTSHAGRIPVSASGGRAAARSSEGMRR